MSDHQKSENSLSATRPTLAAASAFLVVSVLLSATTAFGQIHTVYVVPFAHWDRGFLTSPDEILPQLKPHIDEVIDFAAADPEYRWTIESIWQLNEWLKRTHDPKRIQLLRDLVKRGQIEISGAYGSMHTEFMDSEELNLLTQDSFRMSRALGLDLPELVVMDDVPGYSERVPQVLAGSGVRYFLAGANLFFGGGTSLAPGHVPFYWQSPDGSRVLTWISEGKVGGYVEGLQEYYVAPTTPDPYGNLPNLLPKELQNKPPLEVMDIGMRRLQDTYQKAGYKYDAVLVMYVHDFISPTAERDHLLPWVRKWNTSGREPRLRVATPKEFFDYMLSKYGPDIPTYKGDWTGLWAEVKTNSPGIDTLARKAQLDLRANSLLWGGLQLRQGIAFPAGNHLGDYRRLWNYDEHSGAGQVGWPKLMTVEDINNQNREYVDYARNASEGETQTLEAGLRKLVEADEPKAAAGTRSFSEAVLAVFQPLSWNATSLIHVAKDKDWPHARALRDSASGIEYPIQWNDEGGVAAAPLPPAGVALFEPVGGEAPSPPPEPTTSVSLENKYYRLELRSRDGAVAHLIDREAGKEIVNTAARDAFNQLHRAIAFERAAPVNHQLTFRVARGPVYDALEVLRTASYEPITEYRLYHQIKRFEIRDLLDRSQMPVVAGSDKPNAYQFSFPIFTGAAIESLQYENGNGLVNFPSDYLPGARKDAVVSHGLAFASGDFHVTLSSQQAFYWNLPNLEREGWKLWDNTVLSTVWRKEDAGDTRDYGVYLFPTVEPGLPDRRWFVYDLTSWTGPDNRGEAFRKIWESVMGPFATTATMTNDAGKSVAGTQFATDQPDVVVLAAEPSLTREDAVVMRLQETSGAPHRTRVTLPAENLEATQVDLTEKPVGPGRLPVEGNKLRLEVPANATVTILLATPAKK